MFFDCTNAKAKACLLLLLVNLFACQHQDSNLETKFLVAYYQNDTKSSDRLIKSSEWLDLLNTTKNIEVFHSDSSATTSFDNLDINKLNGLKDWDKFAIAENLLNELRYVDVYTLLKSSNVFGEKAIHRALYDKYVKAAIKLNLDYEDLNQDLQFLLNKQVFNKNPKNEEELLSNIFYIKFRLHQVYLNREEGAYNEALISALQLYTLIKTEGPEKYLSYLAELESMIGILYIENEKEVASSWADKSISTYNSLPNVNKHKYIVEINKILFSNEGNRVARMNRLEKTFLVRDRFQDYYFNINLADLYAIQGDFSEAILHYQKALSVFENSDQCNEYKARTYNFLAETYLDQRILDSAMYYNTKAVEAKICDSTGNYFYNLDYLHLRTFAKIYQVECLQDGNPLACQKSIDFFNQQKKYGEKVFNRDDAIHYGDYIAENILDQMEVYKRLSELRPQNSKQYLYNSMLLVEDAKARKIKNALYESNQAATLEGKRANSSSLKALDKKYKEYLLACNNLETYKQDDLEFYSQLYSIVKEKRKLELSKTAKKVIDHSSSLHIDLQDLYQQLERENTQILDYFLYQEQLWVMTYSSDEGGMFPVEFNQALLDKTIHRIRDKSSDITNLQQNLQELYRDLVAPFIKKDLDNLIIIPHQKLEQLPFEALILDRPKDKGTPSTYLIEKMNVHYQYSLSACQPRSENAYKVERVNIFSYSDDATHKSLEKRTVPELYQGYKESLFIKDSLPSSNILFAGRSFTKSNLLENINADILHLSSHARSDIRNIYSNYLLTRDENGAPVKVYGYEIGSLSLETPHIVLSACETGVGEYYDGMGTFSLSSEFIAAGTSSIVKTLWQVNERSSKEIFQKYYQNMSSNSLAGALRKAKMNYLNTSEYGDKHPYYWSGILLEGDGGMRMTISDTDE